VSFFHKKPSESVILLQSETTGEPVSGLLPLAVLTFRKNMAPAFTAKTLTPENFKEISSGFYAVAWSSEDLDTLGSFTFQFSAPGVKTVSVFETVVPEPFFVSQSGATCLVTGSVYELDGSPSQETITFRAQRLPSVAGNALTSGQVVKTSTDAFGNFSVKLLRGAKVIVELERAAIKHTVTIPDLAAASLTSLLPQIQAP